MSQAATVLICDDEPAIRESIRYVVQKQGFEYLLAGSGEEALHLARTNNPEILLLDWNMPGLTGIEVCEKLKQDQDTNEIYIIMLTANAQANEISKGLNAGANRYVCKPYSPKELAALLMEALQEIEKCNEK